MKYFFLTLFSGLLLCISSSCNSLKPLNFANREWHISDYYGQIIDQDTTYRMTFGNVIVPIEQPIISCADSAAKYPGMSRFIQDILQQSHLEDAEILFYAPLMQTMFVIPGQSFTPTRPSSITSPMDDDKPYTSWIHEDDYEKWKLKKEEMYSFNYFDKSNTRLIFVDIFFYGDKPVAQITIFQAENKRTKKLNLTESFKTPFYRYILAKRRMHIEALSHNIEMRRSHAISNYKIGQEQLKKKK